MPILHSSLLLRLIENSYYSDPLEKKLRETDILATNNLFLDFYIFLYKLHTYRI